MPGDIIDAFDHLDPIVEELDTAGVHGWVWPCVGALLFLCCCCCCLFCFVLLARRRRTRRPKEEEHTPGASKAAEPEELKIVRRCIATTACSPAVLHHVEVEDITVTRRCIDTSECEECGGSPTDVEGGALAGHLPSYDQPSRTDSFSSSCSISSLSHPPLHDVPPYSAPPALTTVESQEPLSDDDILDAPAYQREIEVIRRLSSVRAQSTAMRGATGRPVSEPVDNEYRV